jgi:hypothetical protein
MNSPNWVLTGQPPLLGSAPRASRRCCSTEGNHCGVTQGGDKEHFPCSKRSRGWEWRLFINQRTPAKSFLRGGHYSITHGEKVNATLLRQLSRKAQWAVPHQEVLGRLGKAASQAENRHREAVELNNLESGTRWSSITIRALIPVSCVISSKLLACSVPHFPPHETGDKTST